MSPSEAIRDYLRDDLRQRGHSRLYTAGELAAAACERGASIAASDVAAAIGQAGGITLRYRGGNGSVPISFDAPNRSATLQRIDEDTFSFDTEAAVQNGVAEWFRRRGWIVRKELADTEDVIQSIADHRSLEQIPEASPSRSTQCRDLIAHAPQAPTETFHILEVKGRTGLEADLYETFGQIFPIDDPAVTRGWTSNKVPKHGRCLKYARRFQQAWSSAGAEPLITLVVGVPDFPPPDVGPFSFHDGPTRYYP